jgi:hypothetical protein
VSLKRSSDGEIVSVTCQRDEFRGRTDTDYEVSLIRSDGPTTHPHPTRAIESQILPHRPLRISPRPLSPPLRASRQRGVRGSLRPTAQMGLRQRRRPRHVVPSVPRRSVPGEQANDWPTDRRRNDRRCYEYRYASTGRHRIGRSVHSAGSESSVSGCDLER